MTLACLWDEILTWSTDDLHHGLLARTSTTGSVLAWAAMPSTTLQRAIWDGHPVWLGNAFELRKQKGTRELRAICALVSHRLGWELRLEIGGLMSRTQVCRSSDEVLDTCEHWRG